MENIFELIKNKKPQPRLLEAMQDVLREEVGNDPNRVVYDVYREIKTTDNLRYDLTFLYPKLLGEELPKTYGHYHKHLEIMEVIKGKTFWLIQRYENDPKKIKEVYLIEANENEKVIFPYNFGSISINPTKEEIILSNWMSMETKSNYQFHKKLRGMCYYVLKNESDEIIFEKNKNYEEIPELIKLRPKELPKLGITFDRPLLDFSKKELKFLNEPEKYKNIFTIENCYTKIYGK